MEMGKIKDVTKIGLLRPGGVKDLVVTLPALQALQIAYPEAELVLLGNRWHRQYLKPGRTPVGRVEVVPALVGWHTAEEEHEAEGDMETFLAKMQMERFDLVVDFIKDGKLAIPLAKNLGGKVTVGFRTPDDVSLDRWMPHVEYQSEIGRYLELVQLVGADIYSIEPRIQLLGDDILVARTLVEEGTEYVVLHPGAGDLRNRWPAQKFVDLGNELIERDFKVVVTGADEDQDVVNEVVDCLEEDAINACGKLSLDEITGILAMSKVVVANDTGLLQVAQAVGTKTVGIFWMPNVISWGPVTRMDHRVVMSVDLACPECGVTPVHPRPYEPVTSDCGHEVSFVRDVSVDEVLGEVEELLREEEE